MKYYQLSVAAMALFVGLSLSACGSDDKNKDSSSDTPEDAPENVNNDDSKADEASNESANPSPAPDNNQGEQTDGSDPAPFPVPDLSQLSSTNLTMLVVGDSISTGVFADTERGEEITDPNHSLLTGLYNLIPDIASFILNPTYPTPGEIQTHMRRPELTFLSSSKSWALPNRLKEATPFPDVDVVNLAAVGATSTKTLDGQFFQGSGQIAWIKDQYDEGNLPKKAEVVLYQLGANDFCRSADPDNFATQAKSQITELANLHPGSSILVLPVPDIPRIFAAVSNDEIGISVDRQAVIERWELSGILTLAIPDLTRSCKELQDLFQLCKEPGDSARLGTMNTALETIVTELKAAGNNIGFGSGLSGDQFYADPASLVAGDCFHPSESGHQTIADFVWPDLQSLLNSDPSQL